MSKKTMNHDLFVVHGGGLVTKQALNAYARLGSHPEYSREFNPTEYSQVTHWTKQKGFHLIDSTCFAKYLQKQKDNTRDDRMLAIKNSLQKIAQLQAELTGQVNSALKPNLPENVISVVGMERKSVEIKESDESIGVKIIRQNMKLSKLREKRIENSRNKDNQGVKRSYRLVTKS